LSAVVPLSRVFTYSATKAALLNLTQNLAREWAPHGIRVNAISPGFFPAEQNREVLTPERVESIMRHTPMQRFGNPDELAGAILLMASPKAGSFLTGENIVVDGGFLAMTI
jgi:NAD(P)-dependent dehydrogenase (short-subunit alcohol dehydrogenase family)